MMTVAICERPEVTAAKNVVNGAEIMVQALIKQGMDVIFAYPGGCSMPMHQSLTKYADKIRTILPRHEQGGAFAAQGYARSTGKVGVGQVVIRTTHHLAAVVPVDEALMMITMRYANEIREHKEFDFPSLSAKGAGVTAKELELARKLIEDMAGPWKPEEFEDTYNEDLMKRIEEKVKSGETHELTKPEGEQTERRSAQVIDLMDLLKRSLDGGDGRARKTSGGKREASVTKVSDAPKARAARARPRARG